VRLVSSDQISPDDSGGLVYAPAWPLSASGSRYPPLPLLVL